MVLLLNKKHSRFLLCIGKCHIIFVRLNAGQTVALKFSSQDIMNNTTFFKVFCLERYKQEHGISGRETFRLFREYGVLDYLDSFYDVLHTFGDRYIVADIDEFIEVRRKD